MNNLTKFGLLQSDIDHVISILKTNNKVNNVILFGSRAKGTFKNGSDVDLAIKGSDLKLNDILDAMIEIEELALPYKFDLIIFERIKEEALIDHINRVGIILYER